MSLKYIIKKLFADTNGKIVIWQKPSVALYLVAASWVMSRFGTVEFQRFARNIFLLSLLYWATNELFYGVNLFRRLLGGFFVAYAVWQLFIQTAL
jgi:hypothetical protein